MSRIQCNALAMVTAFFIFLLSTLLLISTILYGTEYSHRYVQCRMKHAVGFTKMKERSRRLIVSHVSNCGWKFCMISSRIRAFLTLIKHYLLPLYTKRHSIREIFSVQERFSRFLS